VSVRLSECYIPETAEYFLIKVLIQGEFDSGFYVSYFSCGSNRNLMFPQNQQNLQEFAPHKVQTSLRSALLITVTFSDVTKI
jgi:hypothetical protein